ncbi:MAG TPA: helix-turn-helix transcriptional regulator [Phycicoccus sp.]|nr:helix-turn-helix transcriptional regulator [Phycicoccus sp.]
MTMPNERSAEAAPALYVSLVGTNRPSLRGLERAGYTRAFLDRELARLVSLGMIRLDTRGAIEVQPPEIALPAYAADLERQAAESRQAVSDLEAVYRQAREPRASGLSIDVRIIGDLTELEEALLRVLGSAEQSVIVVAARTTLNEKLILGTASSPSILRGPALRHLDRAVVMDGSLLTVPNALGTVEEMMAEGITMRVRPELALSVVVVDRVVAVLDVSNLDPSGYGSLIVRHPPLVEALARLAGATMGYASPPPVASAAAQARLGRRHAQILALLAAGSSDASIARQLGISSRTVERHVRRAMDSVGATTRFQAGVEAARQGLI